MASEIIFIVEESPEGGYEAKAVGHSVFTEAETIDVFGVRPLFSNSRYLIGGR